MSLKSLTDEQLVEYRKLYELGLERTKRFQDIKINAFDTKFSYHTVRLISEVEQILMEGDIDLMRNNDQLKDIRNGGWSFEQLQEYFENKEKSLEELYVSSDLQKYPDEDRIKQLLIDCLEEFYGEITNDELQQANRLESAIQDIKRIVQRF